MTNSKPNARGIPFVEGYLNKGGVNTSFQTTVRPAPPPPLKPAAAPPPQATTKIPPPKR